jgi:hypothetical protein
LFALPDEGVSVIKRDMPGKGNRGTSLVSFEDAHKLAIAATAKNAALREKVKAGLQLEELKGKNAKDADARAKIAAEEAKDAELRSKDAEARADARAKVAAAFRFPCQ